MDTFLTCYAMHIFENEGKWNQGRYCFEENLLEPVLSHVDRLAGCMCDCTLYSLFVIGFSRERFTEPQSPAVHSNCNSDLDGHTFNSQSHTDTCTYADSAHHTDKGAYSCSNSTAYFQLHYVQHRHNPDSIKKRWAGGSLWTSTHLRGSTAAHTGAFPAGQP